MAELNYYADLENALEKNLNVVLSTEQETYNLDVIDALLFLSKKRGVVVFSLEESNLKNKFRARGGDLKKLHILTMPNSNSIQEAEVLLNFKISQLSGRGVVVFISPQNLLNLFNLDEIGIFLNGFLKRLEEKISLISILNVSMNVMILEIISGKSDKIIQMRKRAILK